MSLQLVEREYKELGSVYRIGWAERLDMRNPARAMLGKSRDTAPNNLAPLFLPSM